MRGRKPKPTALKLAEGNPGHHPLPANEPKPALTCPEPPPGVKGEALAKWRELAPKLNRLGILTEVDGDCLARYCIACARYWQAQTIVDEEGIISVTDKGNHIPHPALGIGNRQADLLRKLEAVLGLTPADRARIHVAAETPEKDQLDAFLAGDATAAAVPLLN